MHLSHHRDHKLMLHQSPFRPYIVSGYVQNIYSPNIFNVNLSEQELNIQYLIFSV